MFENHRNEFSQMKSIFKFCFNVVPYKKCFMIIEAKFVVFTFITSKIGFSIIKYSPILF